MKIIFAILYSTSQCDRARLTMTRIITGKNCVFIQSVSGMVISLCHSNTDSSSAWTFKWWLCNSIKLTHYLGFPANTLRTCYSTAITISRTGSLKCRAEFWRSEDSSVSPLVHTYCHKTRDGIVYTKMMTKVQCCECSRQVLPWHMNIPWWKWSDPKREWTMVGTLISSKTVIQAS